MIIPSLHCIYPCRIAKNFHYITIFAYIRFRIILNETVCEFFNSIQGDIIHICVLKGLISFLIWRHCTFKIGISIHWIIHDAYGKWFLVNTMEFINNYWNDGNKSSHCRRNTINGYRKFRFNTCGWWMDIPIIRFFFYYFIEL